MNTTRQTLISLVMLLVFLVDAVSVQAQAGVEIENASASYRYGEQITFTAQIKSSVSIREASIVIGDESGGFTQVQPLTIDQAGSAAFRLDMKQNALRPFSLVTWSYRLTLADGTPFQSTTYFLHYDDNRFDWQTLESGTLHVHWYGGDASLGQAALNAAESGLKSAGTLITVDLTQPVDVYLYANADDLRGTLAPGGSDWVAGHADPALGVVMVVIEPGEGQNIRMEQRIPHELTHVMIYRMAGVGYQNLPIWLREGMAALAEVYPNMDYERVLLAASANDQLIPLENLCASFPSDAGQAFLAYAESRSFVNYLRESYGSTGLSDLMASYADGLNCEQGTERAFGVTLSNLESQWRSSMFGQNRFLSVIQRSSPYLVLLCLVLIIPFIGIVMTLRKKGDQNESGIPARK